MGFPVGYTEVFVPKLFVHMLSLLGFIRSLIISLFHYLGLSDFLETEVSWREPITAIRSEWYAASGVVMRETLPVMKLEEVRMRCKGGDETCAVCLCEIEEAEEIRWLEKCKHIFHRCCLDRWVDHDQNTCPLCRTPFLMDSKKYDLQVSSNQLD
uniref:RING-type domain-containing protein n=1 Tax=Kalanchoe fedtschenkoi TaxID=63787 RepID=A0A7N0SV64_KALFE